MVFIGGWRSRRRGYGGGPYGGPYGRGPFGGGYGPGYGGGFGGGGGGCLRDMMLVEGGCCLAEMLGCGPQLLLVIPSTLRRPHLARSAGERPAQRTVRERILAWVLSLISEYQAQISPRRRACCRYSPTCSHYAAEALARHGLWRGGTLAARRLLRCRPGSAGGPDPVPLAP